LQENTCAGFINLCGAAKVFQVNENAPRSIQVFVCFVVLIDPEIQHSEIVFDASEITLMLCLFEVITRRCILNQSAVNIISALLQYRKVFKRISESVMVGTYKRVIVNPVE
jgi:hypothetical protein